MVIGRTNGIVLHPTSLPGPWGIGELGSSAFAWVDTLHQAGVGVWQILPLGPTGPTHSPYQSYSGFAGNPLLISVEALVADDLLGPDEIAPGPTASGAAIDFDAIRRWKEPLLTRAAARLLERDGAAVEAFSRGAPWLDDFARFMAIRHEMGGAPWTDWPEPLRRRKPEALAREDEKLWKEKAEIIAIQALFFRQWDALLRHAKSRGVQIMGDLPIYVAHDSADVWSHPSLFELDDMGRMIAQAGAPPGRFSATGQLWEMPLYRWEEHANQGFDWWVSRVGAVAELTPLIRFDHFNGVQRYWRVDKDAEDARGGAWREGPKEALLHALVDGVPGLSLVAEDLGVITPGVPALLTSFQIPGMRVIQFGFETDGEDPSLPAQYPRLCAGYTSTHDTPTNQGWFASLNEEEQEHVCSRLGTDGTDLSWDLIRAVWGSDALLSVTQLQDLLSLDDTARMNVPGVRDGNWGWVMPPDAMEGAWVERLRALNEETGR